MFVGNAGNTEHFMGGADVTGRSFYSVFGFGLARAARGRRSRDLSV